MSIGGRTQVDPGAKTEARRQWRINIATRGGWPEIPRRHLRFEKFGVVVDERDESRFRVHRGEVDVAHPGIAGFFVTQGQDIVFLEKAARR